MVTSFWYLVLFCTGVLCARALFDGLRGPAR